VYLANCYTNWESMTVVESDGRVTAVGAWGEAEDTTNMMVFNGKLKGIVRFSLRAARVRDRVSIS
jgi:hypothetical protein